MASFVLINTVAVRTRVHLAGDVINDAIVPAASVTGIQAAGGILVAAGNSAVDAAGTQCRALRKSRAIDESALNTIMLAALANYGKTQADTATTNAAASQSSANAISSARTNARGACITNMSLSAFVGVSGGTAQDGVTYAAGERVLLAGQTTGADNGVYVVGAVAAGTAPLTRAADLPTAAAIANGMIVEVSEGTLQAGSTWKAMCAGACVIGTDDPLFYPRTCRGILTLASGTKTLGATEGLYLFSTTRSVVKAGFNTAGGTVSSTVNWRCASAGRTAGKSGTAALTIIATIAAGTIDAANNSTMDWEVTNW